MPDRRSQSDLFSSDLSTYHKDLSKTLKEPIYTRNLAEILGLHRMVSIHNEVYHFSCE